jgi:hypothetical protein
VLRPTRVRVYLAHPGCNEALVTAHPTRPRLIHAMVYDRIRANANETTLLRWDPDPAPVTCLTRLKRDGPLPYPALPCPVHFSVETMNRCGTSPGET